ncbi:DUF1476 domain-containing protein [Notoacmeibacter sp. MSK16QG-6]|uniref:DUF1476 domain-containing protein n=1 Tax=Notoacmeibacter sp. MSK16QG-6 TaxID=2957982 RepID=UPI00209CB363|nr:DUF1476 domain-containing protein [Notoacmeibacter sp. MSK16QG-6]MCP1199448.1 DUF1476 domain-containing protein [Notoacmeibacter sp. MSK16QG-6]
MVSMNDREKGYEAKFAHDEELRFKATVRRNRLLGYWVADQTGKEGDEREAYAKEVIASDFEEAGDEDVFRKLRADLPDSVSDMEIRAKMQELIAQAVMDVEKS